MAMSLSMQLEEVEYELQMRKTVYPRLITRGTLRKSEADFHIQRLEAVKKTLEWLQENEVQIKEGLALLRQAATADGLVSARDGNAGDAIAGAAPGP